MLPAPDHYADSSFLVSLYRGDANQRAATRFIAVNAPVLSFSPLNRVELRNALRNLEARGEITNADRRGAFGQLDVDLKSGLLVHLPVNWTEVFRRADELSEQHATQHGQRTIDLFHVAIALEYGARTFLSFDQRQRRLAKAAGLKVRP
jgi:predicted nucleic acid-binding protein